VNVFFNLSQFKIQLDTSHIFPHFSYWYKFSIGTQYWYRVFVGIWEDVIAYQWASVTINRLSLIHA